MSNPKVSVLLPIYNGEQYLRRTLDSLLQQSFKDFEVVAVNDASTDQSRAIVESYNDPRIRLIDNPQNVGQTASLQIALENSRAEYLARQDQDDVSLPERFAKQVAFLDSHPEVGVLGTGYCVIDEHSQELGGTAAFYADETLSEMAWRLLWTARLVDSSVMFRRRDAVEVGGFNLAYRYAQDYDLWVRLSFEVGVARIPEVLLQFRVHSDNASNRFAEAQQLEVYSILSQSLTRYLPAELTPEDAERIWRVDNLNKSQARVDIMLTVGIIEKTFKAFSRGLSGRELASVKKAVAEKIIKIAIRNRASLGWHILTVLLQAWVSYPVLPLRPAVIAGWLQKKRQSQHFRQLLDGVWIE